MPLWFVTGPVRSGKSRFAAELARQSGRPVIYVATAALADGDDEWDARIARHRAERDDSWQLIETARPEAAPLDEIVRDAPQEWTLLIESTGTWLAHRIDLALAHAKALESEVLEADAARLADALSMARALAIVVGDETGWGVVPPHPSGRIFRDALGRMQQRLARDAERSYLIASGYAIDLKRAGVPIE